MPANKCYMIEKIDNAMRNLQSAKRAVESGPEYVTSLSSLTNLDASMEAAKLNVNAAQSEVKRAKRRAK